MAVGRKRKKKGNFIKRNFIAISIMLVLGSYFTMVILKQQRMMKDLKLEEAQVLNELSQKEQELAEIEKEIKDAGTEEYIEKVAREELDLVKENDIVYRFKDEDDTNKDEY